MVVCLPFGGLLQFPDSRVRTHVLIPSHSIGSKSFWLKLPLNGVLPISSPLDSQCLGDRIPDVNHHPRGRFGAERFAGAAMRAFQVIACQLIQRVPKHPTWRWTFGVSPAPSKSPFTTSQPSVVMLDSCVCVCVCVCGCGGGWLWSSGTPLGFSSKGHCPKSQGNRSAAARPTAPRRPCELGRGRVLGRGLPAWLRSPPRLGLVGSVLLWRVSLLMAKMWCSSFCTISHISHQRRGRSKGERWPLWFGVSPPFPQDG